jgi:hypothetical protein
MAWVLVTWSVLTVGLIVWLADAQAVVSGSRRRERDETCCSSCRHDRIAHEPADHGTRCTQCPCPGFRPPG